MHDVTVTPAGSLPGLTERAMPRPSDAKFLPCLGYCGKCYWFTDPTHHRTCFKCLKKREAFERHHREPLVRPKERAADYHGGYD